LLKAETESGMRRRTLLVVLAGLAVVGAAGTVVLWPRTDRITSGNYKRLRRGMTVAEVEAILGPPEAEDAIAGWSCTLAAKWDGPDHPRDMAFGVTQFTHDDDTVTLAWLGQTMGIWCNFQPDGRLRFVSLLNVERAQVGFQERMRWRFERQRHRWFP
jgi:hypothetical protein